MISNAALFTVVFVAIFQYGCLQGLSPETNSVEKRDGCQGGYESEWIKMNHHEVCVYGHGSKFGHFRNEFRSGLVTGIKLRYRSGQIRCLGAVEHNSRWGCSNYLPLKKTPLNLIVTDNNDQVLFPSERYHKNRAGLWYWLPFVDATKSDELVFTNFGEPFYFPKGGEMRVWYGEDLKNYFELDDQGHVCVDVYALFK